VYLLQSGPVLVLAGEKGGRAHGEFHHGEGSIAEMKLTREGALRQAQDRREGEWESGGKAVWGKYPVIPDTAML